MTDQERAPEGTEAGEIITPYGLMFGPPVPCTLGEIDKEFRTVSSDLLLQVAALGTVVGTGFDLAFGRSDMRTRAVAATAFGPIAAEIDRRDLQFPFEDVEIAKSFMAWSESFSDENPEVKVVPSYRLAFMSNSIQEALSWLGVDRLPVVTGLQIALDTVNRLLQFRGITPPSFPLEVMTPSIRALTPGSSERKPVEIFVAYSHKDKLFRDALHTHMSSLQRLGKVKTWFDQEILPGEDWEDEIEQHLESADIILLLISSDFIASDYCYGKEMKRALERNDQRNALVIPIMIRDTYYTGQPFADLQMLPDGAKAVADWARPDNAWVNVVSRIDEAINRLHQMRQT